MIVETIEDGWDCEPKLKLAVEAIEKCHHFKYEIEMALAGFDKKDIEIEIADGVLTVGTVKDLEPAEMEFVHKGIATRAFTRKFTLSDDLIVQGADLKNGMLTITMERVIPEEKKPRTIKIGAKPSKKISE